MTGELKKALELALEACEIMGDFYEREQCYHESTHRGGAIWTICDDCGRKWADDEGGFVPFAYPKEVKQARGMMLTAKQTLKRYIKERTND